ncbi:MAG: tetratricopeptide repeat protein [Myxococcota bacterium]|jgi:Flp pilus assembly protein TadD|nr:tetratricopeptide repeat protein [Myxococcota bacterium]
MITDRHSIVTTPRQLVVSLLLVLSALLLGGGCDPAAVESTKQLAQGKRAYHKGDNLKAREHLRAAVVGNAKNDEAHFYLGMLLYHQLGDLGDSETHLRRAVELQPENPDYAYQLACVLLARGGESEAETLLRRTVTLRADHAEAHYRLGAIFERREQFDDAIRMYTRAIELNPRFARPYIALATLYERYEHLPQAVQVLENAARNAPRDAEAHGEYGRLLALQGEVGLAIQEYTRALELKGDYPGALFNLGMAYMANQDAEKAIRFLRRYLAHTKRATDPYRVDSAEATIARLQQQLSPPLDK